MEQANNIGLALLQAIAGQTQLPKTGRSGETDEFQKLLEEKSQEKDPLMEEPAKAPPKAQATPAKETEKAPAQKPEDPVEQAKKLAEQGAWLTQPPIAFVDMDLMTGEIRATYEPGEYILAHLGEHTEVIPVTDLDPSQTQELKQLLGGMGQAVDVPDPEADAILEATAPGADNSPAAMLEKATAEQFGKEVRQTAEDAQPKDGEDDQQVQLLDAQQAPRQLFQNVEAAPVKVGEAYDAQQAQEPDVAKQIDAQLAQALQRGEPLVRIQLTPEHLGSVTVEISQSADGILRVALSAHSAETRGLLERHAGDLQGMLSSRGQEVQVEVQRQQESQQGQNQQHQQNYDGRNGHAQDGQERRQQRREHTSAQDFMQQLRLGLIPADE